MWEVWFKAFLHDTKLHILMLLLVVDFILGVIAAIGVGTFRLSYISDFLRNDVLNKIVPFFVVYAAAKAAGGEDSVIPGLDFSFLADGAFALIAAAMVASLLSSLRELGLMKSAPDSLAGSENASPPRD